MGGLGDVEGDAVFEQAELFEALGLFECAGGECGEAGESLLSIGVEAEVLPIDGMAFSFAVERDGGAGEVECAAVAGGDDLDGVGVGDVLRRAADLEGGDFDAGLREGCEHGGDVLRMEQRFVALDVDVDGGIDLA